MPFPRFVSPFLPPTSKETPTLSPHHFLPANELPSPPPQSVSFLGGGVMAVMIESHAVKVAQSSVTAQLVELTALELEGGLQ